MRESIGLGSSVLAVACAVVLTCCVAKVNGDGAGNGGEPGPGRSETTPDPAAPDGAPPPFQLDGGGADPAPTPPAGPASRTMWAIDDANRMVRFTADDPSKVTSMAISGLALGERLQAIDVRPADGKIYGLGTSSRLYVIAGTSGAATAVGAKTFAPALSGNAFGFDVNPVADRLRVHSDVEQNLRLDPTMGTATTDAALAFAPGDVNQGQSPHLVATAYTNSVSPAPSVTVLYAIDSTRNLLTKLATPNDGKITTVGALGISITSVAGFDIFGGTSANGASTPLEAYAVLTPTGGKSGLYTIDLAKGTATLKGVIGSPTPLHGLAIQP